MSETDASVCPKCGDQMDDGRVPKGLNLLSGYKSNDQRHFSFEVNFERARACLGCGYVEMYVDPNKLRDRLGLPKADGD